jgi:hypothetical protein
LRIDAANGVIYELDHAVFDVSGTLTYDAHLQHGVIERMHYLRQILKVHILTADTYRMQEKLLNVALAVDATRATVCAEIEAVVAREVFSITRQELSDVLETFPVLKKRDVKAYREFRTQRLILEALDGLVGSRANTERISETSSTAAVPRVPHPVK